MTTRKLFTTITLLFTFITISSCQAQEVSNDVPEFYRCMEILNKNCKLYNTYNDSIFLIHDHDKWVNYFRQRSIKNHQIYISSSVAMNAINEYFKQDGKAAPYKDYKELLLHIQADDVFRNLGDPFAMLASSNFLENASRDLPDSLKATNIVNLWRLYGYIQMWNLGGKKQYISRAYNCGKAIFTDEAKRYPYHDYAQAYALLMMPRTWWITLKMQTEEEYWKYNNILREFVNRPDIDSLLPKRRVASMHRLIESAEEALVRNTYLVDTTTMDRQKAMALMRKVVDRNKKYGHLGPLSHARTAIMRIELGDITAEQAREECLQRYKYIRNQIRAQRLNDKQLNDFLQPFYSFFYINEIANVPLKEKKRAIKQMCQDIETAYRQRKPELASTDYVRDLERLATDRYVAKYLSAKQYRKLLYSLNVYTQVATYAHSAHVAQIAKTVMKGIFKYNPELLVGMLDCNTVNEVKLNKRKFMKYIEEAAMLHDIGKNSIINVVSNDYRPLTPNEQELIKYHPRFGLKYLRRSPELHKYFDTTLGHHKWYNGKGGYPEDFDNTKSPVRTLIDIVTISDCIQAATEKVGRNYRTKKSVDVVMQELREGAGTIYNPDIVSLIDDHQHLEDKIGYLVDEGWVEIYYEIYKMFFRS